MQASFNFHGNAPGPLWFCLRLAFWPSPTTGTTFIPLLIRLVLSLHIMFHLIFILHTLKLCYLRLLVTAKFNDIVSPLQKVFIFSSHLLTKSVPPWRLQQFHSAFGTFQLVPLG